MCYVRYMMRVVFMSVSGVHVYLYHLLFRNLLQPLRVHVVTLFTLLPAGLPVIRFNELLHVLETEPHVVEALVVLLRGREGEEREGCCAGVGGCVVNMVSVVVVTRT